MTEKEEAAIAEKVAERLNPPLRNLLTMDKITQMMLEMLKTRVKMGDTVRVRRPSQ